MTENSHASLSTIPPTAGDDSSLTLAGRRLALARGAWLLIALVGVVVFVAGAPLRFQQLLAPCTGDLCTFGQLTTTAVAELEAAGFSVSGYAAFNVFMDALVAFVFCAVGLFIFWRRSEEVMALLASLWLVTLGLTLSEGPYRALAAVYPVLDPLVNFYIALGGVVLLITFLVLFPNGRFAPRWMRWVYLLSLVVFLPLVWFGSATTVGDYAELGPLLWGMLILAGIIAQIYRYRRISIPLERQQTKWVLLGFLILAVAIIVVIFLELGSQALFVSGGVTNTADYILSFSIMNLGFMAVPLSIGVSILRYRLWDSDVLIRKTLVYGLVTATLIAVYFGVVVLLQSLLTRLTGQAGPLAIVISTLLIAALFAPVRNRVQGFVDHRFYRRRYDASRILAGFSEVVRDEVDVDALTGELTSAVENTLHPERVTIWLRR